MKERGFDFLDSIFMTEDGCDFYRDFVLATGKPAEKTAEKRVKPGNAGSLWVT